jgi:hypothetical protein
MKKIRIVKETQKGSVELKKGTSDSEIKKYTDKGINVQLVDPTTEKIAEQSQKKYTAEETKAVANEVARALIRVMRNQGNEIRNAKLTGISSGKFNIHFEYGQDKGEDTFKFSLNPETTSIHLDLEGEDIQLSDFIITQGNEVSLPTPELESKLADAMVKYTSNDQVDEKLGPKSKPETYIKDFQKSDAPQFKGKSKEKKRQMAIAAYMANKNEGLDPVGKEDDDINNDGKVDSTDKYLANRRQAIAKNMKEDLDVGHQDNEPAMLKKDVYRIAKMASMLYKELDKFDNGQEVDFPHWWQAKIIKAYDYLQSAYGYLDAEQKTQQIDNTVITTMALNEKQ